MKKKRNKRRNPVARHNKCRGGFHSPRKYSRKAKCKNDINEIMEVLNNE